MVKIEPFEVEHWMDNHETTAKYNIAETCAASISLEDLKALSDDRTKEPFTPSLKLTYGPVRGSSKLRSNLASLYSSKAASPLPPENILITPGAILANYLLLYTLVSPGDHVICHYPTYQQLYAVPASLGAEVSLWKANEKKKWQLDIDELKSLIKPNTKLIIINNPNNPTGAIIPRSHLEQLIEIASEHNIIIHSDEVYRPLFHSISPMDDDFPPSLLSLGYPKAVVTGSLSKAYSMAGLRVGWIASRDPSIIEACAASRHYTTLSVSQIDDQIAAFALDGHCVHNVLSKNIRLAKKNLTVLEEFIEEHRWACRWVKPVAGTTAFVKFSRNGKPIDDVTMCEQLQEKTGVMMMPGSKCFGGGVEFKGYVRIGFVPEHEVVVQAMDALRGFMEEEYENVPLAKG